MADWIVLDEFHLTMSAPSTLRETECDAIYRRLDSKRLHQRLRVAVRQMLRQDRRLLPIRIRLSR
jgi:hypothetical protein